MRPQRRRAPSRCGEAMRCAGRVDSIVPRRLARFFRSFARVRRHVRGGGVRGGARQRGPHPDRRHAQRAFEPRFGLGLGCRVGG